MRIAEKYKPYFILIPSMAFILALSVFPLIYSIRMILFDYSLIRGWEKAAFTGIGSFIDLLTDGRVWNSLRNTVILTGFAVSIEVVLGLGVALLFNREIKGGGVARTLILIPSITAPIVVGLMWRLFFNSEIGPINYVLGAMHLPEPSWLGDHSLALFCIAATDIWEWTPLATLILLAGLQSLPCEPYEAAVIDGASKWQIFRCITLPLLRTTILVVLLMRTMDTLKMYDLIYTMTGGGPALASETISYYLYVTGFRLAYLGRAAAGSYLLLAIIASISLVYLRLLRREAKGK